MFKEKDKRTMMGIKELLFDNKNLPIVSYSVSEVETLTKTLTEKYDEEVAEICVKVYKYMVERRWNLDDDNGSYYLDKFVTVGAVKMTDELELSSSAFKSVETILVHEGMLIKLQFRDKRKFLRNVYIAPKRKLSDREILQINSM